VVGYGLGQHGLVHDGDGTIEEVNYRCCKDTKINWPAVKGVRPPGPGQERGGHMVGTCPVYGRYMACTGYPRTHGSLTRWAVDLFYNIIFRWHCYKCKHGLDFD
jgi:hypothetical protein